METGGTHINIASLSPYRFQAAAKLKISQNLSQLQPLFNKKNWDVPKNDTRGKV